MNFQLISDVHGRFGKIQWDEEADIVLAAGDISENIEEGHKFLRTSPVPVLFIPGNHEYYNGDFLDRQDKMKELCATSSGKVTYVDKEVVIVDDTRIVSTTLWSNFGNLDPLMIECAYGLMNDYKKISTENFNQKKNIEHFIEDLKNIHLEKRKSLYMKGGIEGKMFEDLFFSRNKIENAEFDISILDGFNTNKFSPFFSFFLNKQSTFWLEKALSEPFSGKTVVMTHHAPSKVALSLGDYLVNPLGIDFNDVFYKKIMKHKIGAYTTSLEKMTMNHGIDSWVHGHFHEFMNYRLGSANVICNPTGNKTTKTSGYNTYLFTTDPIEKVIALKKSLKKYLENMSALQKWLNEEVENKRNYNILNFYSSLDAIWDEINVILLNLYSIPKSEIPEFFNVDLKNPLEDIEDIYNSFNVLKYNDIDLGLNCILRKLNTIIPMLSMWYNQIKV